MFCLIVFKLVVSRLDLATMFKAGGLAGLARGVGRSSLVTQHTLGFSHPRMALLSGAVDFGLYATGAWLREGSDAE